MKLVHETSIHGTNAAQDFADKMKHLRITTKSSHEGKLIPQEKQSIQYFLNQH